MILPKIFGYVVKTFKGKDGSKDKRNKLMSSRINDEKPLEKYKIVSTKTESLKTIELIDV